MSLLKYVIFLLLLDGVFGYISSKEDEGYAEGYLSNCPGATKKAVITAKSLKDLGIVVVGGDGSSIIPNRRLYNYYQAKDMAKDPNLDFKKKTMFFFSGFLDFPDGFPSLFMAFIYKRLGYNVLLMSANKFITVHYPISMRFLHPMGRHFAEMLTNLTEAGLDPKRLEFAGNSLGAQIQSFVAKNFQQITGRNVSLLSGLDPAGPCLRNLGPEGRLDAGDADLVITINTNIDGFGMAAPVGHVNFYINGGEYQPADVYWMPCTDLCSHVRAVPIWVLSLSNPNGFIGIKCDSVQQARRHECYDRVPRETNVISHIRINSTNTGIFYVATDHNFPYFLGSKGLKKENEFWTKHLLEWNKDDVISM